MSSHIQFFKDQLKQFDQNVQQWRQEIDERYAWIAKEQEARLRVQAMMEQIFGEPDTTIVMQDMRMRPALGRQPVAALAAPSEAVSTKPKRRDYLAERRRAAERRAVLAKYGQHDEPGEANGTQAFVEAAPKERKTRVDKGTRKPRTGNRNGVHTDMTAKVTRIFLDRPSTPLMSREVIDIVYPSKVPSQRDRQDVYIALYGLKKAGYLKQVHTGEPYTLAQQ